MNERIRELIAQAREPLHNRDLPFNQGLMEYSEKFAELIVRECVEQIIIRERADGEWYQDDIFKHFGVEE